MKRTILILGGIALLCLLLIIRSFYRQGNSMDAEREWFVASLGYEFSATVDSVQMLNENTGKIWAHLTAGNPDVEREDSLKRLFKEHDMLYLIFHREGESIIFLSPNGKKVSKGDSVVVSSEKNRIEFFNNGASILNDQLSTTLTGFGRPFFMKKK